MGDFALVVLRFDPKTTAAQLVVDVCDNLGIQPLLKLYQHGLGLVAVIAKGYYPGFMSEFKPPEGFQVITVREFHNAVAEEDVEV